MRGEDKTIEAIKQALEALQYPWKSQPHTVVNAITALRAAIESKERVMKLRQDIIAHHLALADGINAELAMQRLTDVQQEMEAPRVNQCAEVCERAKLCAICARGLEEMEQEPVAWMIYTLDGNSVCVTDNPQDFTEQHRALPLYTHPPRREWVGLTDEEVRDIFTKMEWWKPFARAIEAKLKEKNS